VLPASFVKGYNRKRLRVLLVGLFTTLALPTGALIWQTYDQLKWEAWYQYRNQAEQLVRQIDTGLRNQVAATEARGFADYEFLSATSTSNVLQRSPLSVFPVTQDLSGVLGYFQLDPTGRFSTPLVPDESTAPEEYGLTADEFALRQQSATELRQILAENSLVGGRTTAARPAAKALPEAPAADEAFADREADDAASGLFSRVVRLEEQEAEPESAESDDFYMEQRVFDQLNAPVATPRAEMPASPLEKSVQPSRQANNSPDYGKVQDLNLDDALQRKDEDQKRQTADLSEARENFANVEDRKRRVETSVQTASPAPAIGGLSGESVAITAFESEIDPYQFSMLDSGHLVLFRNVWRDGSRFIQGLLIDQAVFSRTVMESSFRDAPLSEMSDLVVGYRDDVINVFRGGYYENLSRSRSSLDGTLLYRGSLSAPFDSLELIFSVNSLPAGPGAVVLGWTTLVIAIVFVGGFLALYRLGLSQIRLARQQQDFVSAISHELKTPLTSIRMYGEMLREGWASEEKQKQYYEYIHDESERLTRLISNVLQLAKITRSEPRFESKTTTVGELIDLVRSKISSQVERAGFQLEISVTKPDAALSIDIDDDCFSQIVINLVDNAIKFSRDAGTKRIEVHATSAGNDALIFSVRDFGPGIEKDQLKKIFKLFYRSESELTRETVGTGIGLAIVHQLASLMNGKVDVINRDPGAEFQVSFPVVQKRNV
jgi:signal transduction histidine kinase